MVLVIFSGLLSHQHSEAKFTKGEGFLNLESPLKTLIPWKVKIPLMPQTLKWQQAKFEYGGICKGSPMHMLQLFGQEKGVTTYRLIMYKWRGLIHIIVAFDLHWKILSIWIDDDGDNKAEEYYYNMEHFQVVYGRGSWFCSGLKTFYESN